MPWDLRPTGVPAPEISQLRDDKKKVKQPGAGTQEPVKKQTALEQVTCESDAKQDKDTMSATVKLAKEVDEPDKLRNEGESVDADQTNTDGNKGPDEVFDEGEDTEERVTTLHTEMCEKSEVTSAEEGHDVDGRHAPQSDETADILKQSKDEMSADLTALKKKRLDRKTNHEGFMRHSQGRQGRHLGETSRETEVSQWYGLHPRTWSTRLQSKKG